MTDFHHNIFYYYRGAIKDNRVRERQLEDNTTKALINTLQYSNRIVVNKFLKWLGVQNSDKIHFELQKKTIGDTKLKRVQKKILLGILPNTGKFKPKKQTNFVTDGKSRPDAWIYSDDFAILVESKVVGYVNPNQMNQHYSLLTTDKSNSPQYIEKSWSDIHHFFCRISNEMDYHVQWIINQFTQYLEWNSMTDFVGFNDEIFDYFFHPGDEETRIWIRETMKKFAGKLLLQLEDPFYQSYNVGNLKSNDDNCWVAFGPENKQYKNWAHQTVGVYSAGLEIFVNIELKSVVNRLRKILLESQDQFVKIISALHSKSPFFIVVNERREIRPRVYKAHLVTRLESEYLLKKDLEKDGLHFLENIVKKIKLPQITLSILIDRYTIIESSKIDQGQTMIKSVVNYMKSFDSVVKFINEYN